MATNSIERIFPITVGVPIENKYLCLNMIVKNESKIIKRLFESVVAYIDCFCICDTGSTDDTVDVIKNFFEEHNLSGKIIFEPFKNFGYNRTVALKACEDLDVQHILLLDADMVFSVSPAINVKFREKLPKDAYYIFQGSHSFLYKNLRIVRNKRGFEYCGVTHEYINVPQGAEVKKIERDEIFIYDVGDGGSKTNKFERDIKLLEVGLFEEPNNARYMFYLATSYQNAHKYNDAIEMYKRVIKANGWIEEVWYSYYSLGTCYKMIGDDANALYWWIEGYNFYPERIENLYEIVKHYRLKGKNSMAYIFYMLADEARKRNSDEDRLFLHKDVYDYKLDYELSIVGYYCNFCKYDLAECNAKLLNCGGLDQSLVPNILSNYKFYAPALCFDKNNKPSNNLEVLATVGTNIQLVKNALKNGDLYSSTPSLCVFDDKLVCNVRFVNYFIQETTGKYVQKTPTIATTNVVGVVDISSDIWTLVDNFVLEYDTKHDNNVYSGIEDIRLMSRKTPPAVYFTGNRGKGYSDIAVEGGLINLDTRSADSTLMCIDQQNPVEKNWVLFEDMYGCLKMIYKWDPVIIGDIVVEADKKRFVKTHEITPPNICKYFRGSTNGITIGDEIWFICHVVSHEALRYYYHAFVVLDAASYEVIKYSPLFTFTNQRIEFCLGFVYLKKPDAFVIGYSVFDRTTKYAMFDKQHIKDKLISVH